MATDADRWARIEELCQAALDLDENQQTALLDSACGTDQDLRCQVESLLSHRRRAEHFIEAPAMEVSARILGDDQDTSSSHSSRMIGRLISHYRVVEKIASGGMGDVYRAVRADGSYEKQVAIKIIQGARSTDFFLARFHNERQILASLDHPNIARLLDGGKTEEGLPYVVMEYIQGLPIDEFCAKKGLDVDERLDLFRTVCSAVQYAHQNLVVHRDLKPSNILVTAEGVPKLLDFGIAKILHSQNEEGALQETVTILRILTPDYASPEQVRNEPISTSTDVYSLGVILYKLLTGRGPYHVKTDSPREMMQVICDVEAEKPSTAVTRAPAGQEPIQKCEGESGITQGPNRERPKALRKILEGDLDNIVLKALRKEPRRRYSSVEQFSEDLSRYMAGLPVLAHQDSLGYRASKFIFRHKIGVASAVVVAVAVLIGLAATLYEAHVARGERTLAEQRFVDVRELAKSNLYEFNDAIQNLPGAAPARHLVIQRALQYLDKLSRDAAGDRGLMDELAAGYERIASLQGNFSGPGIGDSGAALANYQKAWAIRESLAPASKSDVNELKAESVLLANYVSCLIITGRMTEASRMAERGIAIAELVVQRQPQDRDAIVDESRAHLRMGMVMAGNGSSASTRELPEAVAHEREAIKLLTQLGRGNQDPALLRSIFQSNLSLAYHLRKNREFEASLKIYDSLWSMSSGLRGLPPLVQFLFYNHRSRLWVDMGRFGQALEDDRKCHAIALSWVQADPHDLLAQIRAALTLGTLGMDEARLGSKVVGKKKLDDAIEAGERLLDANPYELYYKSVLSIGYTFQGEILSSLGDQMGAQAKYSRALSAANELAQNASGDLESRLSVAKLHTALGVVLARARRYAEARQEFSTALTRFDDLLCFRPHDADALYVSKMTRDNLATLDGCIDRQACQGAGKAQLPRLNN